VQGHHIHRNIFYDCMLLMMFMINCKKFGISALNYFAYTFVSLDLPISGGGLLKVKTCSCWFYIRIQVVFDSYIYWFIMY
jgi:hypothetical protein